MNCAILKALIRGIVNVFTAPDKITALCGTAYPVFFIFNEENMDFVTGNIKQLYRKFPAASMASAIAMFIYSFVDTIAVGQSESTIGTAAMAVINPVYGITVFLGILHCVQCQSASLLDLGTVILAVIMNNQIMPPPTRLLFTV